MDNVTHSLIGIAAAELFLTTRPKRPARDRVPLWIASAAANNLPDLDIVLSLGGKSDRLDSLLQHRGYTHTLILAPLQGLLLLCILWFLWRRREGYPWKEISILCLTGPLLHVLADSWNIYGVHPFWPWNNQWFYGDMIFIIEPWLWLALLPLVWKRAESRVGRAVPLLLLAIILLVSWLHPFVQLAPTLAITAGAAAWLYAQVKIRDNRLRLLGAFLICSFAFGLFGLAQFTVRNHFLQRGGGEIAIMTYPANPFCAAVVTAGFDGNDYRASQWIAAPWPKLVKASSCINFAEKETSANLQPISDAVANDGFVPVGKFQSSKAEFDRLAASCRGRAFLRFARIPFWFQLEGRDYFGDLRFDRDRSIEMAEVPLGADLGCPRWEPPWTGRFFPAP